MYSGPFSAHGNVNAERMRFVLSPLRGQSRRPRGRGQNNEYGALGLSCLARSSGFTTPAVPASPGDRARAEPYSVDAASKIPLIAGLGVPQKVGTLVAASGPDKGHLPLEGCCFACACVIGRPRRPDLRLYWQEEDKEEGSFRSAEEESFRNGVDSVRNVHAEETAKRVWDVPKGIPHTTPSNTKKL